MMIAHHFDRICVSDRFNVDRQKRYENTVDAKLSMRFQLRRIRISLRVALDGHLFISYKGWVKRYNTSVGSTKNGRK